MTDGGSSIPEVQALLRVLATGRRATELGTAFGEGTKALAATAASVVTVEIDPARAAIAREALREFPHVELVVGDWREVLPERGPFEFLFADATFKKAPFKEGPLLEKLLVRGGLLVIDDMTPEWPGPDPVREFVFGRSHLEAVEVRTTERTSAIVAARL